MLLSGSGLSAQPSLGSTKIGIANAFVQACSHLKYIEEEKDFRHKNGNYRMVEDAILSTLEFTEMMQRPQAVADAHAHTFSWIFNGESRGMDSWKYVAKEPGWPSKRIVVPNILPSPNTLTRYLP